MKNSIFILCISAILCISGPEMVSAMESVEIDSLSDSMISEIEETEQVEAWQIEAESTLPEEENEAADEETENIPFNYYIENESVTISGYTGDETNVIIPDEIEGYPVEKIGVNAFYNCNSMTSIEISKNVKCIDKDAFRACESLKQIVLPNSLTDIGPYTFAGCGQLQDINLPDSLRNISEGMFSGCSKLKSIELPETVEDIGVNSFQYCENLVEIKIPESVTSIGANAFYGCRRLKKAELPDSLTEISDGLFSGCRHLENVKIPDSVKRIGAGAFSGCEELYSINIPTNVEEIGSSAFAECKSISTISLPDKLTVISEGTFEGCIHLTEIILPDNVEKIEYRAFYGCWNMVIDSFPEKLKSIEDYALYNCFKLKEIELPEGFTSIGEHSFSGGVEKIKLPSTLISIGEGAFSGTDLKSIVIPEGITTIPRDTFNSCDQLKSIVFPEGLISIGYNAFRGCAIKNIEFKGDIPAINNYAFEDASGSAYYPADNATWTSDKMLNYGGTIRWASDEECRYQELLIDDGVSEKCRGTITIKGVESSEGIDSVRVAIWNEEDQSDLKWYTAKKTEEGTYTLYFSYNSPGKVMYGEFNAHVYMKNGKGAENAIADTFYANYVSSTEIYYLNGIDYRYVYDFDFFQKKYPDVRAAFGDDQEATLENFVRWGMPSGRQGSEEFNVNYYMKNYPSLKKTYGNNLSGYYMHYIWWGKDAGLVADRLLPHEPVTEQNGIDYSAVYNFDFFQTKYPDVKAAFGNDDEATLANFVRWGITSGRQGSEEFNVNYYMKNYPSLKSTYGNNLEGYYMHYIWWGKAAGLVADKLLPHDPVTEQNGIDYSAVYDFDYFQTRYPDVRAAFGDDDEATLANFVRWGIPSGRRGSEEFDVNIYKNNYPDLQGVYGDKLEGYYMHYIWWGKAAGLVANKKL